jgi:hypothetical protein
MKLHLADGLALPADEAVSQKYAFLGRSGSGKTYGAMKLAELFLSADAQVIALDWVGNWWALRLNRDGKSPGFEGVYIFGGEHADVPLEMTGGAMMADLLVDKHISAVLDLSPFRKGERTRFVTAFAEQLFHRKKTARTACHLFLEEAQAFLPQMVRGDDARMVGVFEDIGKVGRNYGIGVSILSQRPQAVNKDVLNQTEVLLVRRSGRRSAAGLWNTGTPTSRSSTNCRRCRGGTRSCGRRSGCRSGNACTSPCARPTTGRRRRRSRRSGSSRPRSRQPSSNRSARP